MSKASEKQARIAALRAALPAAERNKTAKEHGGAEGNLVSLSVNVVEQALKLTMAILKVATDAVQKIGSAFAKEVDSQYTEIMGNDDLNSNPDAIQAEIDRLSNSKDEDKETEGEVADRVAFTTAFAEQQSQVSASNKVEIEGAEELEGEGQNGNLEDEKEKEASILARMAKAIAEKFSKFASGFFAKDANGADAPLPEIEPEGQETKVGATDGWENVNADFRAIDRATAKSFSDEKTESSKLSAAAKEAVSGGVESGSNANATAVPSQLDPSEKNASRGG